MPESTTASQTHSGGLRSDAAGGSSAGGDLQRTAEQTARSIADDLKKAGTEKANTGLKAAADTTQQFAESVSAAARNFESQPILGRLANEAADAVERVSRELRTADVDQLLRQVRTVARTNPALFTLGAVALGFGLARFFKAGDVDSSSSMPASGSGFASNGSGSSFGGASTQASGRTSTGSSSGPSGSSAHGSGGSMSGSSGAASPGSTGSGAGSADRGPGSRTAGGSTGSGGSTSTSASSARPGVPQTSLPPSGGAATSPGGSSHG